MIASFRPQLITISSPISRAGIANGAATAWGFGRLT
jgi:hypothetical protein